MCRLLAPVATASDVDGCWASEAEQAPLTVGGCRSCHQRYTIRLWWRLASKSRSIKLCA